MKRILVLICSLIITACSTKQKVHLIVSDANIYTVDQNNETVQAFAVLDGKILATGTSQEILKKYESEVHFEAKGKTILPGFIDAHCHFVGLGFNKQQVNLTGTKSFDEVIHRVVDFQKENNLKYIQGRGWDQNDWETKRFPNKKELDKLFPTTPIVLTRVDGHAVLCNQAALDLGKVTANSKIEGGEVLVENNIPTGVLIDNAEMLVMNYWPKPSRQDMVNAILAAQEECFKYGLTTVNDAGLNRETIAIIDSLHKSGDLKMRIYAMASASDENLDYFLKKGKIKTDRLNVCSFKFYADGALGSRGALMRKPYSDKPNHYGLMVNDIKRLQATAQRIANSDFQMNTHAIGDSANHVVLNTYKKVLEGKKNRRWKIEHAQIISPEDFSNFDNIMPSVQPTHATSDMYWAEDRVGEERLKGAYAYKELLDQYGKIALGTDFPVEDVNPFYTFYASVVRKDLNQYPQGGFQIENALSRDETLRGMTIWGAYSNFEEHEKGSIEVGKFADFIVLSDDIMTVPESELPKLKVEATFVNGENQLK